VSTSTSTITGSAARDQYADVGRSARAVMAAACQAGLSQGEWRVLTAVLHETSTWSRHVDVISVAKIASIAGLASDGQVRAALVRLRDLGLIVYTARRGRPRAGERGRCTIGIPDVNTLPMDVPAPAEPAATPENRRPVTADNPPAPDGPAEAKPPTRRSGYPAENRRTGGATPEEVLTEKNSSSGTIIVSPLPPVPVDGGGEDHQPDEVGRIAAALAGLVRGGPQTRLAVRGRVVELLAAGYTAGEITGHAEARTAVGRTRGTITDPSGLLRHVLADMPPSRAAQAAEREAARQRDAAERRQTAATTDDTATRNMTITDELGPRLHGRIIAAAIAASPIHQRARRSPALVRSLAGHAYADHGYDLDAIRTYAEGLPPGPQESASATGPDGLPLTTATQTAVSATKRTAPTPTPLGDGSVPSLAELEAAIAERLGGVA